MWENLGLSLLLLPIISLKQSKRMFQLTFSFAVHLKLVEKWNDDDKMKILWYRQRGGMIFNILEIQIKINCLIMIILLKRWWKWYKASFFVACLLFLLCFPTNFSCDENLQFLLFLMPSFFLCLFTTHLVWMKMVPDSSTSFFPFIYI